MPRAEILERGVLCGEAPIEWIHARRDGGHAFRRNTEGVDEVGPGELRNGDEVPRAARLAADVLLPVPDALPERVELRKVEEGKVVEREDATRGMPRAKQVEVRAVDDVGIREALRRRPPQKPLGEAEQPVRDIPLHDGDPAFFPCRGERRPAETVIEEYVMILPVLFQKLLEKKPRILLNARGAGLGEEPRVDKNGHRIKRFGHSRNRARRRVSSDGTLPSRNDRRASGWRYGRAPWSRNAGPLLRSPPDAGC